MFLSLSDTTLCDANNIIYLKNNFHCDGVSFGACGLDSTKVYISLLLPVRGIRFFISGLSFGVSVMITESFHLELCALPWTEGMLQPLLQETLVELS